MVENNKNWFSGGLCFIFLVILLLSGCSDKCINNSSSEEMTFGVKLVSTEMVHLIEYGLLTIKPEDSDTVLTETLTVNGRFLEGEIDNIPTGRYDFIAEAFDSLNRVIYRGETGTTIISGEVNEIDIDLYPQLPFMKLSPRSITADIDQSFYVDVRIYRISNVSDISFQIAYDSACLHADSAVLNSDLVNISDNISLSGEVYSDDTGSYYNLNIYNDNQSAIVIVDTSGNADLARVFFTGSVETVTKLKVMPLVIHNADGDSISTEILTDYCRVQVVPGSLDTIPPAQTTTLSVTDTTYKSITLSWMASGDDSTTGMAFQYDIRFDTSDIITEQEWDNADSVFGEPAPSHPGSTESFTVTGLLGGVTYHFAIKTSDGALNWSPLSNSAIGTTKNLFDTAMSYNVGESPTSIFSADFNGDGNYDLVTTNHATDNISVLINAGNGVFPSALYYDTGDEPFAISVADFDGDDDKDLVITNQELDSISIFLNDGDGTFIENKRYAVGNSPQSVCTALLDSNEYVDLIVANYYSGTISVLMNTGGGIFGQAVTYELGGYPASVYSADLDNDGNSDVIVANHSLGVVSILMNKGGGVFQPVVSYTVGTAPSSVFSDDLNNDGYYDLAVANANSHDISVLINNGDGTFKTAVNYNTGDLPHSLFLTDFNGDNHVDIACVNSPAFNLHHVSIHLNNGDGTFEEPTCYGVGMGPTSMFAADIDGDGDYDLAVANAFSNNVSVLMNNLVEP